MERSSEIFNSIKERLSNPFIFSFIASWLVYNWRIAVALFWYNSQSIKTAGYADILEFIVSELQQEGSLKYPLYFSVAITLAIPILRITFTTFNAAITRLGNYLFFRISKESSISTSRYLQLRDRYLQSLDQLESVIKAEGDYELRYREIQSKMKRLEEDSDVLKKMKDEEFLQGKWEIHYSQSGKKVSLTIMSNNAQFVEPKDSGGYTTYPNENLSFFMRDIRPTEKMVFQIRRADQSLLNYNLSKIGEGRYEGLENFALQITFSRIS
ncbi:MAG TPA: hypothetical protein PLX35_10285 [Cyclobacteriaceae bacterium]|nr:hypothetical protein [Cyclobacteriaceae bacterium]